MDVTKLTIQRAVWATALKKVFREMSGYVFKEHVNDNATTFGITHPDAPGWKITVSVCSAHNQRNRLEVNRAIFANNANQETLNLLVDLLGGVHHRHKQLTASAEDQEKLAAMWRKRQAAELAVTLLPDWLDVNIIKEGPNLGWYRVKLLPGNPLEVMALEQLIAFNTLCSTFNQKH